MKNNFLKSAVLIISFLIVGLTACKKNKTEEPELANLQLMKISSWNPATGAENANLEFTYETNGRVKTATSNRVVLTPTYNTAGKVTLVSGVNSTGGVVSYALEYNTAGLISKITYIYMNPTNYGNVKTLTYNTAGKLIQTSTVSSEAGAGSAATVMNYTWNGDNLATSSYVSAGTTYTTAYDQYDDKVNPYSLGDGIAAILSGGPASKNNVTEINSSFNGVSYNQKRIYTYNPSGYAISMKLADGSNEGTKFYYNK